MTAPLTGKQRRVLRGLAHGLRPVVHVAQSGLSDGVVAELETALNHHELVKVRLHLPEDKKAAAAALVERVNAELCGVVGHTVILFRRNPDAPKVVLP